jgi:hypothetical protein
MSPVDREVHRAESLHSVRSDVWAELRAQTTEKIPNATAELAAVRKELTSVEWQIRLLFQRYEDVRGILEEGGVIAQMKLSPMLDAAHGAWLRDRDVPKRIELAEISEAPIPPEDAAA